MGFELDTDPDIIRPTRPQRASAVGVVVVIEETCDKMGHVRIVAPSEGNSDAVVEEPELAAK